VLQRCRLKPDQAEEWLMRLAARRHANIAAVALANKNARIVWALLAHERHYRSDYRTAAAV
jgi:transposase